MEPEEPGRPDGPSESNLRAEVGTKRKRGPYKTWLYDSSVPVPRTTLISRQKSLRVEEPKGQETPLSHDENDDHHDAVPEESSGVLEDNDENNPSPYHSYAGSDESSSMHEGNDVHCDNDTGAPSSCSINQVETSVPKSKIDYVKKYRLNDVIHRQFSITKLSVLLMILHLAVRHCNTQPFIEDQIRFVNVLFEENVLDLSYYLFMKVFQPASKMRKHYFCPDCQVVVGSLDEFDDLTEFITCSKCEREVNVHSVDSGNYFITLSVKDQIKELLSKPGIKIIPTEVRSSDCISDIYDGELYKKLLEEGFPLSNVNALTITFNTDGVAVQNSTKNSLWPIWLYINEICPMQRFKTENLILAGLWFGKSAPNMAMYLKPFIKEILDLSVDGVDVLKPDGLVVKCPVFAVGCPVDAVAKAKLVCQKQFNGICGCLYCHHPNDTSIVDDRMHRYYDTTTSYNERTEGVTKDMMEADKLRRDGQLRDSDSVNGFFGISILLMFANLLKNFACNTFNIVWSVVIDYMHCVLEGVSKDLLALYEYIDRR